jgi:hypothetical protein
VAGIIARTLVMYLLLIINDDPCGIHYYAFSLSEISVPWK